MLIAHTKHSWDLTPKEAIQLQKDLYEQLCLENKVKEIYYIAGADVGFSKNKAFASVIVLTYPNLEIIEEVYAIAPLTFPYIPGLLTFREGKVLLDAFAKLETEPDVIMFDGQGIAHQRGLGLASHIGLLLDKPSIGCAKSRLIGTYTMPDIEKGSISKLYYKEKIIGNVLRTRTNVKPVFVSQGYKIDIETATQLVLNCAIKYRLPEPTRLADKKGREYKREVSSDYKKSI